MSLNNDRCGSFVTGRGLLYDNYVVHFILYTKKLVLICKLNQIITDFFCIS